MTHKTGDQELTDERRHSRARAAIRSALRRYPQELLSSLRGTTIDSGPPFRDLLDELSQEGLALSWLGHASVIIDTGGLSFVVDPVLSERIGPTVGKKTVGLSRRAPAPVSADSIKGVDAILITHAHFDHLDRPTLKALADPRTTVFVPPRCKRLIPDGFGSVIELEPEKETLFRNASIAATTPKHWGARAFLDRRRGSCAYTVRHDDFSVFFAGDTAITNSFQSIREIDLAVFGIGAYNPWEHMHATPEQVWKMFTGMGAKYLLPVHHSTFELSEEPMDEPMTRLLEACGEEASRVIQGQPGTVDVIEY